MAEFTFSLLLALARKIPQADRSTKSGQWDRRAYTGLELEGKTLTLLGFGRIGRRVAMRAQVFGMKIVVYDPYLRPDAPALREAGAVLEGDLYQALAQGDFISAHLPLTPETRGLLDGRAWQAMRPTAFFINTSRGAIVDEVSLLEALEVKRIAGAALDVRQVEPPGAPNRFAQLDNVILTPHIASFTMEAQDRTFAAVCADLDRVLRGEPAVSFVNSPLPRRPVTGERI